MILLFVFLGLTTSILYYNYYYAPIEVDIKKIAVVDTQNTIIGTWWSTIYGNEHKITTQYNIKLPENDFTRYNLVFSTGREIKRITYRRIDQLPLGKDVYKAVPVFKKDFFTHKIFFYRINKLNLEEDFFSKPEKIIIED